METMSQNITNYLFFPINLILFTFLLCFTFGPIVLGQVIISGSANTLPVLQNKTMTTKERNSNKTSMFGILNTLAEFTFWAAKEERIVQILQKRLQLLHVQIKIINTYLKNSYRSRLRPTELSKNEVKSFSAVSLDYQVINRYSGVLKYLSKLLNSSHCLKIRANVLHILCINDVNINFASEKWVQSKELFLSMVGFLHIQDLYGYSPGRIHQGFDDNNKAVSKLKIAQCTELGVFALYRKIYYISVEWLQLAFNLTHKTVRTLENKYLFDLVDSFLKISIQEHNRVLKNKKKKVENIEDFSILINLYTRPIPHKRMSKRELVHKKMQGLGVKTITEGQFMDLCRGNNAQTPEMQKTLKCYYEKKRHPYLYINPVKAEHLSESPPIFQFYEMIGNKTTEETHKLNSAKLRPSKIFANESRTMEDLSKWRSSVGTGMEMNETSERLFDLADMVTGLKIWHRTDKVQYVEYAYGRYYTFHMDHLGDIKKNSQEFRTNGERLATILYYLEVPEKGGYTPFCEAGVSAWPERGSAVFWYNLYRNGTTRKDVNHGSCPVLQGNKIIMNHWVGYFTNWQQYKCSLNQNE